VVQERPAAETLVGAVLEGAYHIERLLGEGGMGAVYHATQLRLDKHVAIKVMARELSAAPEALARFHREALVTSNLGHPNIVQVFDFSTTPTGEPFLVMEFLEGEDLEHRLRREGRLSALTMLHIIKQVTAALMATHAKGIVHRDLKPANIYLLEAAGAADFVKVLDFGISKVRSATTKLTRTASIMGTPGYMSPEQAKGRIEDIDERTDQWALACITWECLAGEGPFVGENVPSILFQIVHQPPPPLSSKVAGLNPQIQDVLLRALAKDKNDRFANVNDFAVALEGAAASTASIASSDVPRTDQLRGTVSSVPRTQKLLDPARSAVSPRPTTFAQTAGELEDSIEAPPSRSKWFGAIVAGAAVVLLLGAFLLSRPRPAPKRIVPGPAPYVPEKRVPVLPVPPVPSAPPLEVQPSVPPQVAPDGKKTRLEGKDKKLHQAHNTTSAPNSRDGVDHKNKKYKPPTETPGQENQDKWRQD
jgi:serine/threonine-protein kinase